MRNQVSKLIKKTEQFLGRRDDKMVLEFPCIGGYKNLKSLILCGNFGSDFAALGDYDEESGKYKIKLKIHGTNFLGGKQYADAHIATGVNLDYSLKDISYFAIFDQRKDGQVFIDSSTVRFKENTVYSLCGHFQYILGADTVRNIGCRFNYSDGSFKELKVETNSYQFYACIPSDEGKTIVSIALSASKKLYFKIFFDEFGIFEGTHTDFNSVYTPYSEAWHTVFIDKPLLGIGKSADSLDLKSGAIKRKIKKIKIDDSYISYAINLPKIYQVELSTPMRQNSGIYSHYKQMTLEELKNVDKGISTNGTTNSIFIKDTEKFPTYDDFYYYLYTEGFDIAYVLNKPEYESIEAVDIPLREDTSVIEVHTEVPPTKFYATYARTKENT